MGKRRVASFEDLDVYKLAFELQQEIFQISKAWPKAEQYSLTDQVRRASRSIGANTAEAWAKRQYVAHFVSKLSDVDGEQNETRHWLKTALACAYLDAGQHAYLDEKCKRIGAMLGRMIADADSWTK
jgi:four helix bundle protein